MRRQDERQSNRALRPRELVIKLTWRCPLRCSHCYSRADPRKVGHLDLDVVLEAIRQACRIDSLYRISFSGGGDPCLHMDLLAEAIREVSALGRASTVVTSGFWAGRAERAVERLRPLAEAGLQRLTLSYDDQHARFVKPQTLENAYRAARLLGVQTHVSIVREPGAEITAEWVRERLDAQPGDDMLFVYENASNSTGRALDLADEALRTARRENPLAYRGPCKSVLRQTSISPGGDIMPCCGVVLPRQGLRRGQVGAEPLDRVIRQGFEDDMLRWLAFEGPVAILEQVTREDAQPLKPEQFDGVCQACDVLFSDPLLRARARRKLKEKRASLALQAAIYQAAGLFDPPTAPAEEVSA